MEEEINDATMAFYDEVDWSKVAHNPLTREEYAIARQKSKKAYATFLGSKDQLQFYMFKPLPWAAYKDIRSKGLDKDTTHEYIINSSIIVPRMDAITLANMDAGIILTLAQQILAVSNFLKDPNKSLEMILEI